MVSKGHQHEAALFLSLPWLVLACSMLLQSLCDGCTLDRNMINSKIENSLRAVNCSRRTYTSPKHGVTCVLHTRHRTKSHCTSGVASDWLLIASVRIETGLHAYNHHRNLGLNDAEPPWATQVEATLNMKLPSASEIRITGAPRFSLKS